MSTPQNPVRQTNIAFLKREIHPVCTYITYPSQNDLGKTAGQDRVECILMYRTHNRIVEWCACDGESPGAPPKFDRHGKRHGRERTPRTKFVLTTAR